MPCFARLQASLGRFRGPVAFRFPFVELPGKTGKTMERDPLFNVRLDAEHRAILEALCAHERLSKSDVFRRALRHYATHLRVKVPKPRKK